MLCSRVQNLLSSFFDQELTGEEMLLIRRHLDGCESCRREHDGLRRVKVLLGSLEPVDPPDPEAPEKLLRGGLHRARERQRAVARRVRGWAAACHTRLLEFCASGVRLALSGLLAVLLLAAAIMAHPQHPDAVSAHVPSSLATEDRAPVQAQLSSDPPAYSVVAPNLRPTVSKVSSQVSPLLPSARSPQSGWNTRR